MKMRKMRVIIGGIVSSLVISNMAAPLAYAHELDETAGNDTAEVAVVETEGSEQPSVEVEPETPEIDLGDLSISAPEQEPEETNVIAEDPVEEPAAQEPAAEEPAAEEPEAQEPAAEEPEDLPHIDNMFVSVSGNVPDEDLGTSEAKAVPVKEEIMDEEQEPEDEKEEAEDEQKVEDEKTEDKTESKEDETEDPAKKAGDEENDKLADAKKLAEDEISEESKPEPKVINTYYLATVDGSEPRLGQVLLTYEVYDNGTVKRSRSDRDGNVYKEEIFEGDDYDRIVAGIEARQRSMKALEEAEDVATAIQDMTVEELMEFFMNMSTATEDNWEKKAEGGKYEAGTGTKDPKDYIEEKAEAVTKEAMKKSIDKFISLLPENEFYKDTLKGMVYGIFGIQNNAPTLEEVMKQNAEDTKELKATIQREIDIAKKENIDVTTIENYGNKLDNFTSLANRRTKTIIEIRDNKKLTDAQKAVQIAELIGGESEWRTGNDSGNIIVAMEAAADCFKGGSDTDPDSRDLYNVIYDFKTHNSLFSGEAMNKSEGLIQKRVQGFIRNCGVVVECFKAHQEVLKLTDEEVASLDPRTKAIYDKIKSDNDSIVKQMMNIVSLFFGNKNSKLESEHNGIFTAADNYYKKEKTVYIDNGTRNVRLNEGLLETHGRDYMKGDNKGCDTAAVDAAVNKAGLTKADIQKIVAAAKARNMSVVDYLKLIGFDTGNIKMGILASGSYDEIYKPWAGGFTGDGYDYHGVEGYVTQPVNGGLVQIKANDYVKEALSQHRVDYALWIDWATGVDYVNQGVNIYTFQAK